MLSSWLTGSFSLWLILTPAVKKLYKEATANAPTAQISVHDFSASVSTALPSSRAGGDIIAVVLPLLILHLPVCPAASVTHLCADQAD